MTTRALVEKIISQKRLAIAGVSKAGVGFGNDILKTLEEKGYEMFVVHPDEKELMGHTCYPSMAAVADQVGGAVLATSRKETKKLVQEAHAAGIDNIWIQWFTATKEAIRYCEENGINAVYGECIFKFADPTGIHKAHHWLSRVLGILPK